MKKIQKHKSTTALFREADESFKKSVNTLIDFANSDPVLPRENRLAIVSGLFAPQWVKKTTYNEIRIALVRACWEKMSKNPQNNSAIFRAINDLSEFAFYSQTKGNLEMLSKLGGVCYKLTQDEPIFEPYQAQIELRNSSWGVNKSIALVLAKPGQWKKMSKVRKDKNGVLHYLTENKRLWR